MIAVIGSHRRGVFYTGSSGDAAGTAAYLLYRVLQMGAAETREASGAELR